MIRHLYRWQEQSKGIVSKEVYCFYILALGPSPCSRDSASCVFVRSDQRRGRKAKEVELARKSSG